MRDIFKFMPLLVIPPLKKYNFTSKNPKRLNRSYVMKQLIYFKPRGV